MAKLWGIVTLFMLFLILDSFAAFEDLGSGARPLGMGSAFVATADDSNAVRYNVAGLGMIQQPSISFTQGRPFAGLIVENHLAGVFPVKTVGSFGLSISQLSEENDVYKEQMILLSYARGWSSHFSTGINARYLSTSFDKDNPSISSNPYFSESTSASAFSLDLGALLSLANGLQLGLALDNLIPADVSIQQEEDLPLQARIGVAYDFAGIATSAQQPALQEILSATRIALQLSFSDGGRGIHTGVESWLSDSMAVRVGYIARTGVHSAAQLAMGASLKFMTRFQFDYAFQWFTEDLSDNTGHHISTSILF